jgi:hypothetical protein
MQLLQCAPTTPDTSRLLGKRPDIMLYAESWPSHDLKLIRCRKCKLLEPGYKTPGETMDLRSKQPKVPPVWLKANYSHWGFVVLIIAVDGVVSGEERLKWSRGLDMPEICCCHSRCFEKNASKLALMLPKKQQPMLDETIYITNSPRQHPATRSA